MIVTALLEAGLDPSFVNGGVIQSLGVSSPRRLRATCSWSRPTSPTARSCSTTRRSRSSRTSTPTTSTTTASQEAFDEAFVEFASAARELVVISSDDAGRASRVGVAPLDHARSRHLRRGRRRGRPHRPTSSTVGRCRSTFRAGGECAPPDAPRARAATTRSTPPAPSPCSIGLGVDPERRRSRGLEAFGGTERRFELHGVDARRVASTTTTPTTPPRSPRRSRPPATSSATGASSRSTSRTSTAAPA